MKTKLKRIGLGYYRGVHKEVDFVIVRVSELPKREVAWFWQITGPIHDWYPSKESALSAVIDFIDNKQLTN